MSLDLDAHLPAIAAGDDDAFARFVAAAEAPLRRSLAGFARVLDTEALLQEALLRVWQVAPRFAPDGAPNALLRFAARVTRNLAISETRRRRPELLEPQALAERGALGEPRLPDPLLRRALERCREALPEKPRAALDARLAGAAERRADAALAAALSMRVNTFLQNISRARKLLEHCLETAGIALSEHA